MELHLELTGSMAVPKSTQNQFVTCGSLFLGGITVGSTMWIWSMGNAKQVQLLTCENFRALLQSRIVQSSLAPRKGMPGQEAWCPSWEGECRVCTSTTVTTRQLAHGLFAEHSGSQLLPSGGQRLCNFLEGSKVSEVLFLVSLPPSEWLWRHFSVHFAAVV